LLVPTGILRVVPPVGKSKRPVLSPAGHGLLLEYVLHLVALPGRLALGHNSDLLHFSNLLLKTL
jgi:hypothetical protein